MEANRASIFRNAMPFGALPDRSRDAHDKMPPMICRAVFEEMFILANGDIVCASPDPTGRRIYGNVLRDRIEDVYNAPMYREIRHWELTAKPDSYCPVIDGNCARRVVRPTSLDQPTGRWLRLVEIEPVSACNLACPGCPVVSKFREPELSERAGKFLSLTTMMSIIDQLPDLQTLLVYGFGEPFLHKDLIPFLEYVKKNRPDVFVAISTNGLPLSPRKIEAIAQNALVDKLVFAIDGVNQDSYAKYRVGGKVSIALKNMAAFAAAVDRAGTRDRVAVVWQYIPFEWNDSDDEIASAKKLAAELGVSIDWLPTHSVGASKRYLPDSPEFDRLRGGKVSTGGGSAELKLKNTVKNGGVFGDFYLVSFKSAQDAIVIRAGERIYIDFEVSNLSGTDWVREESDAIRMGALLQSKKGRTIANLWSAPLPEEAARVGKTGFFRLEADGPASPGEYRVLVDVVEENVCWFHERGSAPYLCSVTVLSAEDYAQHVRSERRKALRASLYGLMTQLGRRLTSPGPQR